MRRRPLLPRPRLLLIVLLAGCMLVEQAAGAAASQPESQPESRPATAAAPAEVEAGPASPLARPAPGARGAAQVLRQQQLAPPPMACYRSASTRSGDAYDCDLAVQIARDSGSAQALAAALTNRALVLTAEGRLEPALADLDAALSAAPGNAVVHGNRGNLLLRLRRPEEALAAHSRAVELAPRDAAGYYNRAFSHLALGQPLQAERDVATARTLLERRPGFTRAETSAPDEDRVR